MRVAGKVTRVGVCTTAVKVKWIGLVQIAVCSPAQLSFWAIRKDEESGARGSRSRPSCSHTTEHAGRRLKDTRELRAPQHAANMQVLYSAQPIGALLGLAYSAAE